MCSFPPSSHALAPVKRKKHRDMRKIPRERGVPPIRRTVSEVRRKCVAAIGCVSCDQGIIAREMHVICARSMRGLCAVYVRSVRDLSLSAPSTYVISSGYKKGFGYLCGNYTGL